MSFLAQRHIRSHQDEGHQTQKHDASIASVLQAWAILTGLVWDGLIVGSGLRDLVTGEDWVLESAATAGNAATGYKANPITMEAFAMADASNDAIATPTQPVGQAAASTPTLWLATAYLASDPGAIRDVLGCRDGPPDYAGWEVQTSGAGGTLIGRYDSGAGDSGLAFAISGDHTGAPFVLAVLDRQQDGTPDLIAGTSVTAAANVGTTAGVGASTTQKLTGGEARTQAPTLQIGVVAHTQQGIAAWGTSEVDALTAAIAGKLFT